MKKTSQRRSGERGYSLVEMMFVVGILGLVTAMAVVQIGASRPGLVGDGGMRVVLAAMNQAREMAITQRRNMRLVFDLNNRVQIIREEVPGPGTTVVSSALMEGGVQFVLLVPDIGDTPDAFGPSASGIAFGTATEVKFSAEGKLINQSGALLNGTVFMALPQQKLSQRAVTIMGSTGRVRGYRWDGRAWKIV